jgi:hypothetical protein
MGWPIIIPASFGDDAICPFHQTRNIAGLPNFAPHSFKSVSVTPQAREQAPQEKMGMSFAQLFAAFRATEVSPLASLH